MQTRKLALPISSAILSMAALLLPASTPTALAQIEPAASTPTPQFTITATNVSVSVTGSGVSNVTLTSLNGFTGQVGVSCSGPSNAFPLVLPNCTFPSLNLTVPANGSVTGKLPFVPPSNVTASAGHPSAHPSAPAIPAPVKATIVLASLLGIRFRRRFQFQNSANRLLGFAILAATTLGAASLITFTGCIGHGGLAMSPGTYYYTIQATNGTLTPTTTTIKVTVNRP
jgi:hypothetical protein